MVGTIVFNVIAFCFACLASYSKEGKNNLIFSFLIIFVFLALRYDFGNDYMTYNEYFSEVHKASIKDLLNFQEYDNLGFQEPGYTWINRLFPNFYLMVAVLSLFSCYIYYNAIRSYVKPHLIWVAVFIFLFNPGFMLVQTSAIRQTVVICLFIYSIRYLIERNFLRYVLLILIGSLFHRSALVLLPLYFLVTPIKWGKWILVSFLCLFLVTTFFGYIFLTNIEYLAFQYFPKYYTYYMSEIVGTQLESGLGFLFLSFIFLFILWSHNKVSRDHIVISKLSIIGYVLYPIGLYLVGFGRIVMYFTPIIILSLPFAISLIKYTYLRILVVSILIFFYLYVFITFFQNPIWVEKFSTYKTILINGK